MTTNQDEGEIAPSAVLARAREYAAERLLAGEVAIDSEQARYAGHAGAIVLSNQRLMFAGVPFLLDRRRFLLGIPLAEITVVSLGAWDRLVRTRNIDVRLRSEAESQSPTRFTDLTGDYERADELTRRINEERERALVRAQEEGHRLPDDEVSLTVTFSKGVPRHVSRRGGELFVYTKIASRFSAAHWATTDRPTNTTFAEYVDVREFKLFVGEDLVWLDRLHLVKRTFPWPRITVEVGEDAKTAK